MKAKFADSNRLNILGAGNHFSPSEIASEALKRWRKKIGFLSIFASVPAVLSAVTPDVLADQGAPRLAPLPRDANSQRMRARPTASCTKPELLRRQSNFLLPHQKGGSKMVSALIGNDSCPGKQIPVGVYTSAAPFTDTGNTTGADSTVKFLGGSCGYYYYYANAEGPDLVYSFVMTGRGASPEIRVTQTTPGYSPMVYVLNGQWNPICPVGPNATAGSCMTVSYGADNSPAILSPGQVEYLPLNVPLYLFVDSPFSDNRSAGAYTLSLKDVTVSDRRHVKFDFDPDSKADLTVYRPSNNIWYELKSSGAISTAEFGENTDKRAAADYDGDGRTDLAVFRPSNGTWYVAGTKDGYFLRQWGQNGDIPVPSDYDGDGKTDFAVFRPSNGTWYLLNSRTGISVIQFGATGDSPEPGDFNRDGKTDLAVYRPSNSLAYIKVDYTPGFFTREWGANTDIRTVADFDGDGSSDLASFRPSTGVWTVFIWDNTYTVNWGQQGDIPAVADYDGDGSADIAVYRPSNGTWYLWRSRDGISITQWGTAEDKPVPATASN